MTSINLDLIQFYQAPTKADLAGKRSLRVSIDNVSVTDEEGYNPMIPRPWADGANNSKTTIRSKI